MLQRFQDFCVEHFTPKRLREREEDDQEAAKPLKLKRIVKTLLEDFHLKKLTLEDLQTALLQANPYPIGEFHHTYYVDWINDNIDGYAAGEHYRLSLTSSGGMLSGLES